jgi:hypothetical protein
VPGLAFREVMDGRLRMGSEVRPFRFDFAVHGTKLLMLIHWLGAMTGSVTIGGFVADAPATGELETAPIRGWMRYAFTFHGPSGEQLRFDGRKRIRFLFFGWTVLRGSVTDATGAEIGQGILRFSYRRHFWPFLRSFRTTRGAQSALER